MDFENRLKGKITQGLLESLLEDVSYRIVPLGIEEVVREIKCLDQADYLKLGLPLALRKLPDFFVALPDLKKTWLIEVKYRKRWDEEGKKNLQKLLLEQAKLWQPLFLVLFLGESAKTNDTPANRLGVCKLTVVENTLRIAYRQRVGGITDGTWEDRFVAWEEANWDHMSRFQDVFDGVSERYDQETLIKAISAMESLGNLGESD